MTDQTHEEYVAPDKPLKDFTDQEREEFRAELAHRMTDEQFHTLEQLGYVLRRANESWTATREHLEEVMEVIDQTRNLARSIAEEVGRHPELEHMSVTDFLDSGKLEEILASIADTDQEQDQEQPPTLTSIVPQKHVIPNNKLANTLREIIDAGATDLLVDKNKSIATRCVVAYEGDNVKLSSRQPFTEYDRSVADAVTSLYLYGDHDHVITAAGVYRAMVHATEGETPSPQQIGAVTKSLDKMRFVRVQIDCSEELKSRRLSLDGARITGGKVDTYLLALEKLDVKAGGRTVSAYKILQTPVLYDYAHMTKQVLTLPAALLEIRDSDGARIPNTEQRIVIRDYLLRRIAVMKGRTGKKQSHNIVYDTLFAEIGEADPNKKKRQHIREYVEACLDSWTRAKFIRGYNTVKSGRTIAGVEIIV